MSEKRIYEIKRMHWEPDPVVLNRLQAFYDYQLSIEGEIYKALQREIDVHGKHGQGDDK